MELLFLCGIRGRGRWLCINSSGLSCGRGGGGGGVGMPPAREDDALREAVSEPAQENSSLNSSSERSWPGKFSVMNRIDPPRPESLSES